jgi:Trypsin
MATFEARRVAWGLVFISGCSGSSSELSAGPVAPSADIDVPVVGVADLGSDPAVVAIDWGGPVACAGALVASDVVLTARHCVSYAEPEAACTPAGRPPPPLRQAGSMGVRVTDGGDFFAPRVLARNIVVPPVANACGADIAFLELEDPIDAVRALVVNAQGVAIGGHVRSVGFAPQGALAAGFEKRVRDHVLVVDTTATEALLSEALCTSGCGGPAIDEATGEIVGVVSHGGPDGDVATRADAFLVFIEAELARAGPDRPSVGAAKEKKGAIDMGANCILGSDCAAGVCVTDAARRYCSRSCSPHDHCPAHYRCEASAQGSPVCVAG